MMIRVGKDTYKMLRKIKKENRIPSIQETIKELMELYWYVNNKDPKQEKMQL